MRPRPRLYDSARGQVVAFGGNLALLSPSLADTWEYGLPTGVLAYGRSSPRCTGPLAISAPSSPRIGNAAFAVSCDQAPPSTAGLLAITGAELENPIPVLGIDLWINPTPLFVPISASSNAARGCDVLLPIPNVQTLVGGSSLRSSSGSGRPHHYPARRWECRPRMR